MKLRSFQNEAGEPVDERVWQDEHIRGKRSDAEEESIRDEEIENFLDTLDFQAIDQVFREECLKSDSDTADDPPIDREMFFLLGKKDKSSYAAAHHSLSRLIKLVPENIRSEAKELEIKLEEWLLFVIFHEIAHDYSFTVHKGMKEMSESNSAENVLKDMFSFWRKTSELKATKITGYSKVEVTKRPFNDKSKKSLVEQESFYRHFDEGVTDKVAFEMIQKYRGYHPEVITKEDLDKMISAYYSIKEKNTNKNKGAILVDDVIVGISRDSGVSEAVVWEAIKRGKFGKENLNDEDTKKILQTELPWDVYSKMVQ